MNVRLLPGILSVLVLTGILAGCDSSSNNDPIEVPSPRSVAEDDYTTTESGLKYHDFSIGEGTLAEVGTAVRIHYITWLQDGQFIDSSYLLGNPAVITLGSHEIIPGWEEGLLGMRVGGDRQIVIPPELAYGENGQTGLGIPSNATLIIEVALLAVGFPVQ